MKVSGYFLCSHFSLSSHYRDLYCMVAGGAGGVRRGFLFRLGLSLAVGGTDFEGVFSRLGVPVIDVLAPGIYAELGG
jgi:hypothetical protein